MIQLPALEEPCPVCDAICGPEDIISVDVEGSIVAVYFCTTCRGASWEVAYTPPAARTEKD